jgi:glycosyltransferase involved in cell wall biosynthesis
MVHVLHVNKFLHRRGGAESYMLDLAAAQQAAGHAVSFFAMDHPDNVADRDDDLFPSRMELNPPPPGVGARIRTAAQIVHRRDARTAMAAMLDRVRPDVVHLHNIYHQLSPSILKPIAERRIASVMTLHDYKLVCPTYQLMDGGEICEACLPGRFGNAVKRRCNNGSLLGSTLSAIELGIHTRLGAYDPVDVLVCPSEFLRTKMHQGGIDPRRTVHLTNFCDLGSIRPATTPGRGVLYAGRLSHEKGVDVLVDAAAHLPDDVPVTIAGDGPERELLEKRTADAGLGHRVTFLGRVPAAELHERMRAAAVVAAPSRWYENQPMTVLEAFGCARPVVASRIGGLPELVTDGVTGALVPHDDPVALADAVRRLAGDPVAAHAMGRAARDRAVAAHDIDTHVAGVTRLYDEARSKRRAGEMP